MEALISVLTAFAVACVVWPVVPRVLAETAGAFREGIATWWPHTALFALIIAVAQLTP